MPWVFRTYQRPSGRDDVRDWYAGLRPGNRATVLNVLQYLRDRPRDEWLRPDFDLLHGKCGGMGEVRFKFDGVQNRLIGHFGPWRLSLTFLLPVLKRGRTYDPRNWEDTAIRRRTEVEADSGCTNVWLS
jgi:hypothetical protein